jgi:hypothetical protein
MEVAASRTVVLGAGRSLSAEENLNDSDLPQRITARWRHGPKAQGHW